MIKLLRDVVKDVNPSFWWAAFVCQTLLIAYCLLGMRPPEPSGLDWIPHLDKVAHFVLFGVQAALLVLALSPRCDCTLRPSGAGMVSIAYGAMMEVMQLHLPSHDRTFSLGDIAANSAGALVFAFLVARIMSGPADEASEPQGQEARE